MRDDRVGPASLADVLAFAPAPDALARLLEGVNESRTPRARVHLNLMPWSWPAVVQHKQAVAETLLAARNTLPPDEWHRVLDHLTALVAELHARELDSYPEAA